MKIILFGMLAFIAVFLNSCNNSKSENTQIAVAQYKIGDIVPGDQVCMVNNAYMGKKQLEVIHDGNYGCCENCKLRIPQEENARMAVDPVSKKQVDKATAIIAVSGQNDAVSYFESKANYKAFFNNDLTL